MLHVRNENTGGGYFLLTGDSKIINQLISAPDSCFTKTDGNLLPLNLQPVWNSSDQQIRMIGGEIYTTREKDTSDSGSRLHLIDIPSAQAYALSLDLKDRSPEAHQGGKDDTGKTGDVTPASGEVSSEGDDKELWGQLIAEINYIASLKSVMFDHKAVFENLKKDWSNVCIRNRSKTTDLSATAGPPHHLSPAQASALQHRTLVLGDVEIIGVPYIEQYLPANDRNLISKFLCEWPILVLNIEESPSRGGGPGGGGCPVGVERYTHVMPLNPVEDVVFVSKAFRKELDRFLEGPPTENHFDFSVFSALHVMELVASYALHDENMNRSGNTNSEEFPTLWIPHVIRPEQLRAYSRMSCSEKSASNNSGSIQGGLGSDGAVPGAPRSLHELNNCCAALSKGILTDPFCAYQFLRYVCISIKSGFDTLVNSKPDLPLPFYDALAALNQNIKNMSICSRIGLRCSYSPIKYGALLMYGISSQSDQYISQVDLIRLSKFKSIGCDVRNIYPAEPKRMLPIHKLSTFLTKVVEHTPILVQDVAHSEIASAFERLRQIGNAASSFESVWFQFNADLFYMSTIAHQTMRGEISQKSLSSIWALPREIDPNVQWLAVFAAGFAFTLELPSRLFECLEQGRLCCEVEELFGGDMEYYVIHLDYKDLAWEDYRERLKEMYRLKDSWTKLELCAWLDRCLTAGSIGVEEIILNHLKSSALSYENENLHLEKRGEKSGRVEEKS